MARRDGCVIDTARNDDDAVLNLCQSAAAAAIERASGAPRGSDVGAEIAGPDNAAPDIYTKVFQRI